MCKLVGWTGMKKNPLVRSMADYGLCAAFDKISETERDGFGFAQRGTDGLHARFVKPSDFRGLDMLPTMLKAAGSGAAAFDVFARSEQTGTYNTRRHLIGHGRTATHGQGLRNTHPFRHAGWTLAHNGVVSWTGEQSKLHREATCDSQHILYALTEHPDMESRRKALENIEGYAAFLALTPTGRLIVAVDDTATLHAGVTLKGRWIFGTTAAIVDAVAEAWECKKVESYKLASWMWLEFPEEGGEPDVITTWKHDKASYKQSRFSQRSLGRSFEGGTYGDYHKFSGYSDGKGKLESKAPESDWKWKEQTDGSYRSVEVPAKPPVNTAPADLKPEGGTLTQHNLDDDDATPSPPVAFGSTEAQFAGWTEDEITDYVDTLKSDEIEALMLNCDSEEMHSYLEQELEMRQEEEDEELARLVRESRAAKRGEETYDPATQGVPDYEGCGGHEGCEGSDPQPDREGQPY